jgi:hypothetical protein
MKTYEKFKILGLSNNVKSRIDMVVFVT